MHSIWNKSPPPHFSALKSLRNVFVPCHVVHPHQFSDYHHTTLQIIIFSLSILFAALLVLLIRFTTATVNKRFMTRLLALLWFCMTKQWRPIIRKFIQKFSQSEWARAFPEAPFPVMELHSSFPSRKKHCCHASEAYDTSIIVLWFSK